MPIAGMLFWSVIAVAGLRLKPVQLAYMVGFGSGMIFPLGMAIDALRGRRFTRAGSANPVTQMFLQSLALVVLLWPFVIIASSVAHEPDLIVLGGAILIGIVWIPYGWAAEDRTGLEHAVGRSLFSYAAYVFAPHVFKATAISLVVLLSYLYALLRMRRPSAPLLGSGEHAGS